MNKIHNNYDKDTASNLNKWRLILGKYANNQIEFSNEESGIKYMNMDNALDFLYGREYGEEDGVRKEKKGVFRAIKFNSTILDNRDKKIISKRNSRNIRKACIG